MIRILYLLVLLLSACTKQASLTSTSVTLTSTDLRAKATSPSRRLSEPEAGIFLGDEYYAQVDSRSLPAFYDYFRQNIFDQGVTRWDERFDCNHFASYYVALAQTRFYLDHFQSWTTAQTLAVGSYWYQLADGRGHAIVFLYTERGWVFLEPQNGQEVTLTAEEQGKCWLKTM